jgi:tripartite-type tricarboxylate transporter receptor subunit TctC
MRSIAVRDRSQALVAEIPTVDEARLPRFYVPFWVALRAAKGTPKDVIAKLNSAAMTALAGPTVSRY